nr:AMP-binding protein [Pseudobdellovibrionaceae bacterium]
MEKIWLKKYPAGVEKEIKPEIYGSILDVYEESVRKFRDQPAFTNLGVTMTYHELSQKVDRFASFLQHELRLKKGDRIAIQMPNLLQFPVAAFGAMKAGLIVVNTNPLYTAKEMQHQFKDSGAKAIVILANYAHLLQQILKDTDIHSVVITEVGDLCPFPKNLLVNSVVKFVKKMVPAYQLPQAYKFNQALEIGGTRPATRADLTQEDIALLQYTGGTTGVSKGAVLTHRNVIANMLQIAEWMKPKLTEGKEIALTALPM